MLKFLRKKDTQKKIFIPLTVAVIGSFAIWGIIVSDDDQASDNLGQIGNKSVSIQDYLKSYKAVQHQMDLFYGEKSVEIARLMNMKGQAWDRILLLDYAKKEGIKTKDDEVVAWIGSQFSRSGRFDELLYKRYVEQVLRSNPRDFEEEVRQNLTIAKVYGSVKAKAVVSDEEINKRYEEELKKPSTAEPAAAGEPSAPKPAETKEQFKTRILNEKFESSVQKLLEGLRNNLKLNLEVFNKIFPPEETEPEPINS